MTTENGQRKAEREGILYSETETKKISSCISKLLR